MTEDQMFEEYWRNRFDKGWWSQFEDKVDAARSAWLDGYKKGKNDSKREDNEKVSA